MNGATFYKNLHSEYFSLLSKLIQYYKENPNDQSKELLLENFKSEQIDIPNVQLNLEPIYVNVKDIQTCKTLIDLTLQLLSESLPLNSININKHKTDYYKLFNEILHMIEHYNVDLKFLSLKFFINLISNYDQIGICKFRQCFPFFYLDIIYSIEAMLKSINVFYEKGEIDAIYLDNFNKLMHRFMKMSEESPDKENKEVFLKICVVILKTKGNKIFCNELKLQCLSLSKYFEFPRDLLEISNMDASEIEMLTESFCKNILLHIETKINGNRSVCLKQNWCYNQVLNVINSIKTCDDNKIDIFLISYHLKRCLSGLAILQQVRIQYEKLQDKPKIEILLEADVHIIWGALLKLIEYHKSIILGDIICTKSFMNILLGTVILYQPVSRDECNRILQLLCLQSTPQFSENTLGYSNNIKAVVLKYMMVVRLVLAAKLSDVWVRIISNLVVGFIKNKKNNMYIEVSV